jgi:hypothetical protein
MTDKNTYLVSPGGSGCNWMYALFGERFMKADYTFHNVHQRFAQVPDPETAKVLYLMAHPVNILLSLSRRFWTAETWIYHIRMIQGDINGLYNITEPCDGGEKPTIERYAKQGLNLYDFHQHAAGWKWYCSAQNIPFLQIKYEEIPDRIGEIIAFVGKAPEHAFEVRKRESDYKTDERKEMIEQLAQIHLDDIWYYSEAYGT